MHNFFIDKYKGVQFFLGLLIVLFTFGLFLRGSVAFSYVTLFIFLAILMSSKKVYNDLYLFLLEYKKPFIYLFIFFIWIVFQPFIINSEEKKLLFSEIKSQFVVPILFLFVGALLVVSKFKYLNYRLIFNLIFYTGFIHVVIVVIMAMYYYLKTGTLPIRESYILEIREMSYFTNLIYSFFLAELYIRFQKKGHFLFFNNFFIPIFLLIFISSIYLQGMRWGVITFCSTSLFFFLLYFVNSKISILRKLFFSFILFLSVVGIFSLNVKYDKRWDTFVETLNITIKDNSLYWVDRYKYECPKLSNGDCVDDSNYLRLKQFIEGIHLIKDYPLGNGYSRHTYQVLVNKIYNADDNSFNFPHSGIINLFLGVGIIGTILYIGLVLFFILKLIKLESSYPKIFTIFFIIAFHSRALVDMTFMNHNLKMYFFVLGIGLVSSLYEDRRIKNEKTKIN